MFTAYAGNVNSNPRTQDAILRQAQKRLAQKTPEVVKIPIRTPHGDLHEKLKLMEAEEKRLRKEKLELELILAQEEMREKAHRKDSRPHTRAYIAEWVCRAHGVTLTDLRADKRDRWTVLARKCFVYWCRELTGASMPSIGRFINKDHSTCLHAYRTYWAQKEKLRKDRPRRDEELSRWRRRRQ